MLFKGFKRTVHRNAIGMPEAFFYIGQAQGLALLLQVFQYPEPHGCGADVLSGQYMFRIFQVHKESKSGLQVAGQLFRERGRLFNLQVI